MEKTCSDSVHDTVKPVWLGLGRAIGGSFIFSLPMMMTMEMWAIGSYIHPLRLFVLILFSAPLFYHISLIIGFRKNKSPWDNFIDVSVAYLIAFCTTGALLWVMSVIKTNMHIAALYSVILLQTVPGCLGALIARDTMGEDKEPKEDDRRDYLDDLTVFATGALFLCFSLAPSEEMMLISYKMNTWHTLLLLVLTLLFMHAFTLAAARVNPSALKYARTHQWLFIRYTSVAYLIAVVVSFFMLWIFESPENYDSLNLVKNLVVLGFPAGIGAAAARLIL